MRYVISLLFGLAAGVAAAGALLYFNPLTRSETGVGNGAAWSLNYSLGAGKTWLSSHNRRLDLPVEPRDAPLLAERGIRGTIVSAMPMTDAEGTVAAAASRLSVPSTSTEFLHAGVLVEDYWLISVPGEGSVFVHAVSNQWPLLRDTVVRVDWLQRQWTGPGRYTPTTGPARTGARVVGISGGYAGASGHGAERLSLDAYDGSLAPLTGELLLTLAEPRL